MHTGEMDTIHAALRGEGKLWTGSKDPYIREIEYNRAS
jgi:hypothetical protein